MKACVVTTGAALGLLTLAHPARIAFEDPKLAGVPDFLAITLVSAALCLWSWRIVRRLPR